MKKATRAKWLGLLAALTLALALMSIKHREWMLAPNDFIFGESPDGFKNYLTAAYHIERDLQATHYEGMNYPFGEHVLFTDNQPILSTFFQFIHQHVMDLTGQSVGIYNTIQLLSWIAGAGVLFLFLFRLKLPAWYAVPASLGILFLSPQYNRFDGHFGLSHTWIFPLLLLLLLRYEERGSMEGCVANCLIDLGRGAVPFLFFWSFRFVFGNVYAGGMVEFFFDGAVIAA